MTATTIRVQMAQRKDTAAGWTAANPILLSGEIGYETDTKKFKIGNGSTNWNSLAYLPIPDGSGNLTITGNLEIGTTGSLTFEGSTADGFETTLAVTNPTADRTITLPNVTGTVITSGDTGSVTSTMLADGTIVNADINSAAEIAVSKLANGTANQVIVTDGTNVSWSDNLTLAGDLTVNGTTTTINTQDLLVEDKNIIIGNVATPTDLTADGGGITLKGATDKTINWVDSTDAWTLSENVNIASGKEYRIAGTKVLDATSLGSSVLITTTNITDGTIVDGDINASAAIAGTKISPDFGSQNVTTTGNVTVNAQGDVRFGDADSSNWVAFQGPATIASNVTWTLPSADGSANQVLSTDGSGTLSWATTAAGATDKIEEGNTSAEVIDTGSDGRFVVTTEGSERLRVDSSGRLGIGTTSASERFHVVGGNSRFEGNYVSFNNNGYIRTDATNELRLQAGTSGTIFSNSGNSEIGRWDSSGRFLVGTSSARGNFSGTDTPQFQIEGTTFNTSTISVTSASSLGGGNIELAGTGTGTVGNTGTVSNNGYLGSIHFLGGDGTNLRKGAAIDCQVDGTPGANDMPGRLVFSTTADGASSPTERMRIGSNGQIDFGNTANGAYTVTRNTGIAAYFDRRGTDGTIIQFEQDGNSEGTISVSGTTVSYNGAHLSRWSQLPGGAERTEILRGTVLSNIDEMCAWGEEENEQLNRMKVSEVEGDTNVAGVFQAWDDDDDTYTDDFYCAMTGDFIIRIAEGVTVQRGDLLMSAGDGTAKPQDDDVVRSKTIAKVTSTQVTCTYEDGSYCVPCVLMAC